eukprot:gene9324-17024_t
MAVQATFVLVSLCFWGFATANISSNILDPSASVDDSATVFATSSGDSAATTSTMETGVVTPTTSTMATTTSTVMSTPGGGGGVVPSQSATATAPLSTAGSGGGVSSVGGGTTSSITPTATSATLIVTPTINFGGWLDNCKETCCQGLGQGRTFNKTRECKGATINHCKADIYGLNTTIAVACPEKCINGECTIIQLSVLRKLEFLEEAQQQHSLSQVLSVQNVQIVLQEIQNRKDLIDFIEKGLKNFSGKFPGDDGGVVQPVRTAVDVKEYGGVLLSMPAYSSNDGILSTKLVSLYSENSELGLPSHQGVVVSFDPKTGTPSAVLDAESITNLRTAAATAVATKHLASPDAKVLAIIGCGHQAQSHIELLKYVKEFSERKYEKVNAKPCESVEVAVKDADVIVTVTLSKVPVVFGKWTKQNCLINIIGACRPDWREVDDDIMQNSQVIVDTTEGALKESGDVILSKAEILGELGNVISGSIQIDFSKRRVFKSLGMALEDGIAAKIVLENMHKHADK